MKQKGRTVQPYRPGVNRAGVLTLPASDLQLDGMPLFYRGIMDPVDVGGGASTRIAVWFGNDGLTVTAALEPLPHMSIVSKAKFLHIAVSYPDRYPTWDEMTTIADAFAGPDVDLAMLRPRRSDYVNLRKFCLHFWELPVEWGVR